MSLLRSLLFSAARPDSALLRELESRGARDSALLTLDFGLARFLAAVTFAVA